MKPENSIFVNRKGTSMKCRSQAISTGSEHSCTEPSHNKPDLIILKRRGKQWTEPAKCKQRAQLQIELLVEKGHLSSVKLRRSSLTLPLSGVLTRQCQFYWKTALACWVSYAFSPWFPWNRALIVGNRKSGKWQTHSFRLVLNGSGDLFLWINLKHPPPKS